MEDKYLLPGEQIITQSDTDTVTLTNLRIRYSDKQFGKAHIISIMLTKISSIEVRYQSNVVILVLAVIGFLAAFSGFYNNEPLLILFGLLAGGTLIGWYIGTRTHALIITSDGGKEFLLNTSEMKHETVLSFMNQVEQAISEVRS